MIKIYQTNTKNKFPFNLFAILIKLFQKTNYSHYAMSYISETGKTIFLESTFLGGVRRIREDKFLEKNEIKKTFVVNKKIERISFIVFTQAYEGNSYGKFQIIGLLAKLFNIVKFNPFGKGAKRIICNELVILFLNWFNFTTIKRTDSLDLNDTQKIILEVLKWAYK